MRKPELLIESDSSWEGLESILEDILDRFDIGRERCIEFGVEWCYSTVALSNFFQEVVGVDTFEGDITSGVKENHFVSTAKSVEQYKNIKLIESDYQDYIKQDDSMYDFAHVDIIHTYEHTYACGLWAIKHSKCCIFHDTESFPEVRRAVRDLARDTGKKVYNYPYSHGLGIIV
jgi:hypothetical protein